MNIENMTKNEALTALIGSGDYDFNSANKYWNENKPEKGVGFKARFYEELTKGEMTEVEFDTFLSIESDNIKKNRANFNGVRMMANEIWSTK